MRSLCYPENGRCCLKPYSIGIVNVNFTLNPIEAIHKKSGAIKIYRVEILGMRGVHEIHYIIFRAYMIIIDDHII